MSEMHLEVLNRKHPARSPNIEVRQDQTRKKSPIKTRPRPSQARKIMPGL